MVSPQLLAYVRQQEAAGYSDQQIAFALQKAGYPDAEITDALHQLPAGPHNPDVHAAVEQYARMGYSALETRQYLQQQGMKEKEVRRALRDVYGTLPEQHKSHTFLFAILAIIVCVAAAYYLLPNILPNNQDPPDPIIIQIPTSEIISQVLLLTRNKGPEEGVSACQEQLVLQDKDYCLKAVATLEEVDDMQICNRIVDTQIHDACYMSFLNKDFEGACAQMQLARSKDTCDNLRDL